MTKLNKTEKKVLGYLKMLKQKFPSLCGADIWVIKNDCKLKDITKVRKICVALKEKGMIKMFKKYRNAFEYVPRSERKKK